MAITSPEYIIDQYKDWHASSLAGKNMENVVFKMQNQSLLGRWLLVFAFILTSMSPSDSNT